MQWLTNNLHIGMATLVGGYSLYCEFPSNPLLRSPPLGALAKLARQHGFPLIVDDSISGFYNVDLLGPGGADILVSSLTKQFSGSNNAMGGSLVLNPDSPLYSRLHERLDRDYEPLLWRDDAAVLLSGSSDYEARCQQSNTSAMAIVDTMQAHRSVARVYHPSCERTDAYNLYRREDGGYGALVSLVFHVHMHARLFYDALDIPKGPGFGSSFTLACPYTMIAHYNELDWCSNYGVDRSLVRLWCGIEPSAELTAIVSKALNATAGR